MKAAVSIRREWACNSLPASPIPVLHHGEFDCEACVVNTLSEQRVTDAPDVTGSGCADREQVTVAIAGGDGGPTRAVPVRENAGVIELATPRRPDVVAGDGRNRIPYPGAIRGWSDRPFVPIPMHEDRL